MNITKYIDSKNTILFLAGCNVLANTQKISYLFVNHSFNFTNLNTSSFFQVTSYLLAWLLAVVVVVSLELSILFFVAKGVKWLGGLFAFLIFVLNFSYFTESYIYSFGPMDIHKIVIDFILSALSPIIVFAFSELYIKEKQSTDEEKQQESIKSFEKKINSLEAEKSTLKQNISNLEKNESSLKANLQDQKTKISNLEGEKSNFLQVIQTQKQNISKLSETKEQLKVSLREYKSKFTCPDCNEVFESQFKLRGHTNAGNCKPGKEQEKETIKEEML